MRAFSFETRNTFVIQSRAEFYLFKRVIVLQHCSKEIELNYRKVKGLQVFSLSERRELSSSFSTHHNLLRSEGKKLTLCAENFHLFPELKAGAELI